MKKRPRKLRRDIGNAASAVGYALRRGREQKKGGREMVSGW